MKRIINYFLIAICAASLLTSCIKTEGPDDPGNLIETGDPIPAFSVEDKDGNTFNSSSMAGKRAFIFFFQTTCPDCQKIFPEIEKIWQDIGADDRYVFLAINRGQAASVIAEYFGKTTYTMHYYLDPDRETYNKFAESYVPRLYIADDAGIVEWMAVESLPGSADTAEELLLLIKGQ